MADDPTILPGGRSIDKFLFFKVSLTNKYFLKEKRGDWDVTYGVHPPLPLWMWEELVHLDLTFLYKINRWWKWKESNERLWWVHRKGKKATEVHLKLFFFQIFWWRVDRESESIKVDIKRILSIGSIDNLERNRLVVFLTSNFKKKRDIYRIWEREREMYPFKEPNDSSTTHSRSSSLLFSFFFNWYCILLLQKLVRRRSIVHETALSVLLPSKPFLIIWPFFLPSSSIFIHFSFRLRLPLNMRLNL
jgi:hypothetical protein